MTSHGDASGTPRESEGESFAGQMFPWLLGQKIAVPDRVAGYVHRAELVNRAMPTRRRVTVLNASAGFGKTTLLAECCRRLRRDGVATAWVSLDEQDEPAVLDTYIAFACHDAGLNLLEVSDLAGTSAGPESRVGVVVHQIQRLGRPFVIAFDELERLTNPASVSLLEFLLQRGPSNLHLAIACRSIPDGLNVAGSVLEGRAEVVGTEDLRFSKPDVARFFGLGLSRRELAAEMDRSAGWPFAVRISGNRMQRETEESTDAVQDVVQNWVESRLFAGLGRYDRDFLLDIGLFDWIDAELLDEVLRRTDSMRLLNSMRVLVGLLEPVSGGATENWRLHPLVRGYCAERRFRETPERFRAIHRRIAEALTRRGDTVPAMRHAVEGGEPVLAGEILERAGAIRLWIRQGLVQLQAADRWLSEGVISARPRLALVRCVVLSMSGRLEEARKLFREVAATRPILHVSDQDADFEYAVDDCIVRGVLALYGGATIGSNWRTLSSDFTRFLESEHLDPPTRGHMKYGLCVLHQLRAEFDIALERLSEARQFLAQSEYMMMYGELLHGQVAMAQGQVRAAESHYRGAQVIARKRYVFDPVPAACAEIMLQELAMECNRVSSAVEPRSVSHVLTKNGAPFSVFAAAGGLVIERRLWDGRIGQALTAADEFLEYARGAGLTSLIRHFAALRISVLVIAGRIGDAERAWRLEDHLPEDSKGCVDLDGQGWREMEAISLARLRCLIASERFEEGRDLARELRAVAVERRLRRTLMRALALSMVLEQRAGDLESALGHLEEYLGVFVESPYAWSLVRERATCTAVATKFLDLHPDSPQQETARSLVATMHRMDQIRGLVLSEREREVLLLLDNQRDKQIAAALGLTTHGVRHHLRKLFAKLGVAKRAEAVRRARELGLLADDS